ncbi:MAG: FHA domain-containing protein [Phycisphaerales bacterium]|nr:FHA domain-containing protein [Phycisphaerales bacterium]
MPSIIVRNGAQEGLYLPLGKGTKVIGRHEASSLQIDDEGVSRRHVQIRFEPKTLEFYATDMKSRNGTFVRGRRIDDEVRLSEGDEIIIGSTTLVFTEGTPTDKANALEVLKQVGERGRSTLDMR